MAEKLGTDPRCLLSSSFLRWARYAHQLLAQHEISLLQIIRCENDQSYEMMKTKIDGMKVRPRTPRECQAEDRQSRYISGEYKY